MGLSRTQKPESVDGNYLSDYGFTIAGDGFFKFVEMELLLKKPIIFFDLETTGLSISADKIIEISVAKFFPGDRQPEVKTRKINPKIIIPEEASKVHGITNEDVKDAPTFEQVAESMFEYFEGCDIAGYNIGKFDVPLLREEFLRCGLDFPGKDVRIVDVYKLVCAAIPRNLGAMYEVLTGNSAEGAHGAEFDNMMSIEVLSKLINGESFTINPLKRSGLVYGCIDVEALAEVSKDSLSNGVDFANRIALDHGGEYIFNFGKHKGKRVLNNFSYTKWMLANDFPQDTKDVLMNIWKNHPEGKNLNLKY